MEGFEIIGVGKADGGTMISVTPCDKIFVLNPDYTGVIAIFPLGNLRILSLKCDGLITDFPVNRILAESHKDVHAYGQAVTAEYSRIPIPEGHHGTVKNTVGNRHIMSPDHGILRITPHRAVVAFRPVLPGYPRQRIPNYSAHIQILLILLIASRFPRESSLLRSRAAEYHGCFPQCPR